ncbi:MAG: matrixin family metalloprotease, partial [Nanoarchaeota archaeon]
MRWWEIFSSIAIFLVIFSLLFYWFIPFKTTDFQPDYNRNSNFSINSSGSMQFYPNMRYPEPVISYSITDCTLKKKDEMVRAFDFISNLTVLKFYPTGETPEISITCDSNNKIEGGLFIAGEGGPTNITKTEKFSVILAGKILLIRESGCKTPNVPIHELMHVLGFDHSDNSGNLMYPISDCSQTIGEDSIELINQLYSVPSYPDLSFEGVSATMHGAYLDTDISIRNNGLKQSETFKVKIYADEKMIKEI